MPIIQMEIDQFLLDNSSPGTALRCPIATAMARIPHLRGPHVVPRLITVGTPRGLLHCSTSTGLQIWIHRYDHGYRRHPFTLLIDTDTRHAYIQDDPLPDTGPTRAPLGLRMDATASRLLAQLHEVLKRRLPARFPHHPTRLAPDTT